MSSGVGSHLGISIGVGLGQTGREEDKGEPGKRGRWRLGLGRRWRPGEGERNKEESVKGPLQFRGGGGLGGGSSGAVQRGAEGLSLLLLEQSKACKGKATHSLRRRLQKE